MRWHIKKEFLCTLSVTIALTLLVPVGSSVKSALAGQSNKSDAAIAKGARLGGDKLRTRFVADLSKKVEYRIFSLDNPYRVIVDIPNVNFQLPEGLGNSGRGLVSAYRYGLFAPGKSRIVIDVNSPFLIDKSFVLNSQNNQPARLVIDLVPTDRATFLAKLKTKKTKVAAKSKASDRKSKYPGISFVPPSDKRSIAKPLVIIDPGHGGIDPGAVSPSGAKEKNIAFEFAQMLKSMIEANARFRARLTRNVDVFVPLQERVDFARKHHGNLFISIHADSLPKRLAKGVRGATIYTLSEEASDEEAKVLAQKENRADIIAGVELPQESNEVANILIDLVQRETKNHSIAFSKTLLKNLKGKTKLNKKPQRSANFRVLKAPDVPSILLELGYLSNKEDEKLLQSEKWRKEVATAIAQSVETYFTQRIARVPF